jgi:hypothetical protein
MRLSSRLCQIDGCARRIKCVLQHEKKPLSEGTSVAWIDFMPNADKIFHHKSPTGVATRVFFFCFFFFWVGDLQSKFFERLLFVSFSSLLMTNDILWTVLNDDWFFTGSIFYRGAQTAYLNLKKFFGRLLFDSFSSHFQPIDDQHYLNGSNEHFFCLYCWKYLFNFFCFCTGMRESISV